MSIALGRFRQHHNVRSSCPTGDEVGSTLCRARRVPLREGVWACNQNPLSFEAGSLEPILKGGGIRWPRREGRRDLPR